MCIAGPKLCAILLQICFEPPIAVVDMYVRGVRSEMIRGLAIFRRLPELLDRKTLGKQVSTSLSHQCPIAGVCCWSCGLAGVHPVPSASQPIHDVVEGDEEIKKVQAGVVAGLEQTAGLMREYLQLWEP